MTIDANVELGKLLIFTHGIDLSKDVARNCGVNAKVDWNKNIIRLTSQDEDLIAQAVERFNNLERFYVCSVSLSITLRVVPGCPLSIFKPSSA
jgi:hypothetical protein